MIVEVFEKGSNFSKFHTIVYNVVKIRYCDGNFCIERDWGYGNEPQLFSRDKYELRITA